MLTQNNAKLVQIKSSQSETLHLAHSDECACVFMGFLRFAITFREGARIHTYQKGTYSNE